jgi:hypothetical protein
MRKIVVRGSRASVFHVLPNAILPHKPLPVAGVFLRYQHAFRATARLASRCVGNAFFYRSSTKGAEKIRNANILQNTSFGLARN